MQICVMNHKSRSPEPVVAMIRREGRAPEVFTDHTDYYQVRGPFRYFGVYSNFMGILKAPTTERLKLIFHDDVIIPPGLFERIEHILKSAPEAPIAFYNPTNASYREAAEKGHHVLSTYANVWGPCMAFPVSMVADFAEWCDKHVIVGSISEDGALWRYLTRKNILAYAAIPSLIQHDGLETSTFGNPKKAGGVLRNSANFTPDFDVHQVDWEKEFAAPFYDGKRYTTKEGLRGVE